LALRPKVIDLYVKEYGDYGPTLFGEMLEEHHRIEVDHETLRRWLLVKGHWTRQRKTSRHRKRRERRAAIGAMIQFDGSEHDWFEDRGPRCTLLVAVDDASGKVMLRFAESESTLSVLTFWRDYVQRHGIPQEAYTDHGSVYYNTQNPKKLTDYGLAMKAIGVTCIYAHSPQAKGRVERANRTFQDRLLKALRRQRIATIDEANRYLEQTFTRTYNNRFAHPEGLTDVHRPCVYSAKELSNIFCSTWTRSTYNDNTVTFEARYIQLERSATPVPPPRSHVTLRRWLDGSLHIFWNENELAFTMLPNKPDTRPRSIPMPKPEHPWNYKYLNRNGAKARKRREATPLALRARSVASRQT